MPQPHRLSHSAVEHYPTTEAERQAASARISNLCASKQSCASCCYFNSPLPKNPTYTVCIIKADKRVAHYNICINHKTKRGN